MPVVMTSWRNGKTYRVKDIIKSKKWGLKRELEYGEGIVFDAEVRKNKYKSKEFPESNYGKISKVV